jgi:hypothetical protein
MEHDVNGRLKQKPLSSCAKDHGAELPLQKTFPSDLLVLQQLKSAPNYVSAPHCCRPLSSGTTNVSVKTWATQLDLQQRFIRRLHKESNSVQVARNFTKKEIRITSVSFVGLRIKPFTYTDVILAFKTETHCVYCAVRNKHLNLRYSIDRPGHANAQFVETQSYKLKRRCFGSQ